ncbi:unnamed protein product [Lasius platythorax]|uniref:Uncharacterized protein n=1 Tax=Lasius platythorax TaxID=488582 RepID=A0AAV2NEU7_9HYME
MPINTNQQPLECCSTTMHTRPIERNFGLCLRPLRGPALFSRGNTVDSEDRQMIDGIGKAPIVTVPHRSGVR